MYGLLINGGNVELLIIAGVLVVFLIFTSIASKKKREEMSKKLNEQLVPGAWVQTIGGFCGKVVEIDGDVIVLATPTGEESLWLIKGIARVEEPPFAIESSDDENVEDLENEDNDSDSDIEDKSQAQNSDNSDFTNMNDENNLEQVQVEKTVNKDLNENSTKE